MAARVVILLLALSLAAAGAASTYSAFSSKADNTGNAFQASADFSAGPLRMATGTYTGDGVDDRSISTGFRPDLVIVKATTASAAVLRTSTMAADAGKTAALALQANLVQGLDATAFRVGTDARVNASGTTYHWVALQAGNRTLSVGSYTGNGSARSVTGLGFAPEWVAVLGAGAQTPLQRYAGMSQSYDLDQSAGDPSAITGLGTDGFSLGTSTNVAASGTTFHWIAMNAVPGSVSRGGYTGNGVGDRQITGIGFQPDYVMVRAAAPAGLGRGRPASLGGTSSLPFGPYASGTTGIRALLADGFSVGTDGGVNGSGTPYWYLAMRNTAGCLSPGTQTLTASEDSWVDQSNPSRNYDADTVLRVRTNTVAARSLVRFSLPSLPAGCSVTGATLRLYAESAQGTRTLEAWRLNGAWAESAVTWGSQPATTGTAASTPNGPGWLSWNVTSHVQAMYAGSNYGWLVKDSAESDPTAEQVLGGRSYPSTGPQLVVTFG